MEMSTKRAVGRFRQVIDTAKSKNRDPRFDEVSAGTFRQELFDRSYGFLDEKRDQEITKLKKAVSKERRKRKGREGLPESKIETLKAALIQPECRFVGRGHLLSLADEFIYCSPKMRWL